MKKNLYSNILVILMSVLCSVSVFAQMKEFVRDYSYHAGEDDSKRSSRARAIAEVKRALLEELGTYVESTTEVHNYMLTKDEITAITAGITQLAILEEKWDGVTFYLKALIKADADDVEKRIKDLVQERSKIKELEDTLLRERLALEQVKKLQEELKAVKKAKQRKILQKEYNLRIDNLSAEDFIQQGNLAYFEENFYEAFDLYMQAITLQPKHFGAYYRAGLSKMRVGDYDIALSYFEKSLTINSRYSDTHFNLGKIWFYKGSYDKALKYYLKAIELNPTDVNSWYNIGYMFVWKNEYEAALPYLEKTVAFDLQHYEAYYNLGVCYNNLGRVELGFEMMMKSAQLGNEKAQKVLIEWGEPCQ